jgi:hypothetical protein
MQSKGGSIQKSRPHVRIQMIHSFSPLHAHVRRHHAVEPRLRPPSGPLVLDGRSQPHPITPPGMKVYAAKPLIFLNPVGIHLFWLVVQLIALRESITTGISADAKHGPKILRELSKSIWGKLVKLQPKLQQNIS